MVSAETDKDLVQPVYGCDGVYSTLTVYCSVSLFLGKKGKLANQVNKPNFIISITTLIFTIIQKTGLFEYLMMCHKTDTFQGIMQETALTKRNSDPLLKFSYVLASLRQSSESTSSLIFLKEADDHYPYPQTFKITYKFPVPLCISLGRKASN